MEKTKFTVVSKLSEKYSPDLKIYCISQTAKEKPDCGDLKYSQFLQACRLGDFKGNLNDVLILYNEVEKTKPYSKRIAFIGTGLIHKKSTIQDLRERCRIVGGNIAALCKKLNASKVCVVPPKLTKNMVSNVVYCLTEGLMLGDYSFTKYKTEKDKKKQYKGIKEVKYIVNEQVKDIRRLVALASSSSISACHARNMAYEPGNTWIPESFAIYAREISKKYTLKCNVFEKRDMEQKGMGGILAVNQGSSTLPKLVVVEYHFSKKSKTILLVGKGLTFDSGGISLKPATGMMDMKYDMCGGAAVLAAMNSIGIEAPDCNVVAIVPATDNMAGASALKPGDVIYHYNNISSEIVNTDAEGRLILADALAYGIEKYNPDYVIDLATLTGSIVVGLGHHYSGLFSNNRKLAAKVIEAGKRSGEPIWQLPLGSQYAKQIDSKVADMKNTGGKAGGAITAAEYLQKFVGNTPWVHLDIAGTAWSFTEKSYIPDGGPSGVGVRTLLEFVRGVDKDVRKSK